MTVKNKINLSIAIFIVLFVLIVFFIVYPLFTGIKNNSKELILAKNNLVILETKINNLEKFKVLYQDLEEILGKINNLFINPDVPVEFINFLETTSGQCFLDIEIFATSPRETKEDPWPSLVFQISSTGSFPNFLKFLEKLENSPYLIEIQNLNVNRTGELGEVNATFSIKVFTK